MKNNFPNLFIIGAAKAGTTSLFNYLSYSDNIFVCPIKEPHYFSNIAENEYVKEKPKQGKKVHSGNIRDEETYLSLFENSDDYIYRLEASTSYLFDMDVAKRIYSVQSNAKIIVILRNQIQRAFSHYLMDVKDGNQNLDFYNALVKDYNSQTKGWSISHLYVELGFYTESIKHYIKTFGKENVQIILFDDLKKDLTGTLQKICSFLNLDYSFINKIDIEKKYNEFKRPKSKFHSYAIRFLKRIKYILPGYLRPNITKNFLLKNDNKPEIDNEAIDFLNTIYKNEYLNLNNFLKEEYNITSPLIL